MAKHFDLWVSVGANGEPVVKVGGGDPDVPLRPQHRGVNLTGGSTGYTKWDAAKGPTKPTHYQFVTQATIDNLMASLKANAFRVLFTWEALQPTPYAVIDTLAGNFKTYRDALFACVAACRARGAAVLLDIHGDLSDGFAGYRGIVIPRTVLHDGKPQKVEDMLANLWRQLAAKYKDDPGVMIGVTNEPHDIAPAAWFTAAQKVIDAVRSTGSVSKIVMPGVNWTGAGSWMLQNADAWNLVDPAHNLAVQVHLYFDSDQSGSTSDIVSETIGVERLEAVTSWCRKKGIELWLAEFAVDSANAKAPATLKKTLDFVNDNRDVFGGLFWWAQGPIATGWSSYRFGLFGADGKPTGDLDMLVAAGGFGGT